MIFFLIKKFLAVTPCINCLTIQSNSLPLPIYGTDSKKDKR